MACNLIDIKFPLFETNVTNQQQQAPSDFVWRVVNSLENDSNFDRVFKENVSNVIIESYYTCKKCKNRFVHEGNFSELILNTSIKCSDSCPLQTLVDESLNRTRKSSLDSTIKCKTCKEDTLHETIYTGKVIPKEYMVTFCILILIISTIFFLMIFFSDSSFRPTGS